MKKIFAFTLAETLIVIGIIGVVAALTLPNLNHATGDKEKVTKVKKIYSALTDAFDRAQVIYGDADTWFKDIESDRKACSELTAKRVTEFMKVSKICGIDAGCFSSSPLLYPQSNDEVYFDDYLSELQGMGNYMVTLSDGISLAFYAEVPGRIDVHADIDGPQKGKNKMGSDIFKFSFGLRSEDQSYFLYLQLTPDVVKALEDGDISGNATAWVIQNGNLDYLKCLDELDWDTKTSCE